MVGRTSAIFGHDVDHKGKLKILYFIIISLSVLHFKQF